MYVRFNVSKMFSFSAHMALAPFYGLLDGSFTVTIRSNLSSKSFELSIIARPMYSMLYDVFEFLSKRQTVAS